MPQENPYQMNEAQHDLVVSDIPRGFGRQQAERERDLHDDSAFPAAGPTLDSAGADLFTMGQRRPGRSVIAIQHDQDGIRMYIEGRTRVILSIVFAVIFLLSWPGMGDRVLAIFRLVLQGH